MKCLWKCNVSGLGNNSAELSSGFRETLAQKCFSNSVPESLTPLCTTSIYEKCNYLMNSCWKSKLFTEKFQSLSNSGVKNHSWSVMLLLSVYCGVLIRCKRLPFKLLSFYLWIQLTEDLFTFCENDKACQWNDWYFELSCRINAFNLMSLWVSSCSVVQSRNRMLLFCWKLFCFPFSYENADDQSLHFWPFPIQVLILQQNVPCC